MTFKIESVEFMKSAAKPEQFPSPEVGEIAFTGRSNVGKSSLLNLIVRRKSMAKTSKTPGKTRLVNFFDVRLKNLHLRLVDLPGYGYAKVKNEMRQEWSALVEAYLTQRPNLKLVCSLVDCRHSPSSLDIQLVEWLRHCNIPFLIVMTKSDKIPRGNIEKNKKIIRQELSLDSTVPLIPFSVPKKVGREELWKAILEKIDD